MDSIHDYVLKRLKASKKHLREVSEKSGIPYGTLRKVADRRGSVHPRIDTLEKIAAYFRAEDDRRASI